MSSHQGCGPIQPEAAWSDGPCHPSSGEIEISQSVSQSIDALSGDCNLGDCNIEDCNLASRLQSPDALSRYFNLGDCNLASRLQSPDALSGDCNLGDCNLASRTFGRPHPDIPFDKPRQTAPPAHRRPLSFAALQHLMLQSALHAAADKSSSPQHAIPEPTTNPVVRSVTQSYSQSYTTPSMEHSAH